MADNSYTYSERFFDYISEGSRRSANVVAGIIQPLFTVGSGSVLDTGCGQGVWLQRFLEIPGVDEGVGVDGNYVRPESLYISRDAFLAHDLTRPLDLKRQFTLGLCLEVGEHLPPTAGPTLVDTLTRHASMVLFSAAVPGQGGERHTAMISYPWMLCGRNLSATGW